MFRKLMIAGCAIALMSVGGLETADAAKWRLPRTSQFNRRYRDLRQDYNQARRQVDRYGRRLDNRYYRPIRSPYYRGYRGYRRSPNGFVSTPYFSIGF